MLPSKMIVEVGVVLLVLVSGELLLPYTDCGGEQDEVEVSEEEEEEDDVIVLLAVVVADCC